MSFTKELTSGLIKKGLVSEDHRQELEKYLHARDMFNDLFGKNDDSRKIIGDLLQNQDALREHVNGLMGSAKKCGRALEKSISFVHEIEELAIPCLEVLDKSLQSGLKQKTKIIYELADELDYFYSRVTCQADEIGRHIHEHIEILANLNESLIDFESEMRNIKVSLIDNEVDNK